LGRRSKRNLKAFLVIFCGNHFGLGIDSLLIPSHCQCVTQTPGRYIVIILKTHITVQKFESIKGAMRRVDGASRDQSQLLA
jgi:hypothetical protein